MENPQKGKMKTVPFNEEDWKKGREVRCSGYVVRVKAVCNDYAWIYCPAQGDHIVSCAMLSHNDDPLDVPGNVQGLSAWTIGIHEGWRVVGPDEESPEDAELRICSFWQKSMLNQPRDKNSTYRTKAPKPSKIELPFDQLVWVRGKDTDPYTWSVRSLHDFRDMRTAGIIYYRIGNGPWMEVPK